MKYFLPIFIFVVGVASFIAPIKSARLPFTTSTPIPPPTEDRPLVGCTDKAAFTSGFPFRISLYDECEKDESIHQIAFAADVVFWLSLVSLIYAYPLKKRSQR